MNYDWKTEDWTIPLNLTTGKTIMFGKTPVKLELEVNYYVEQPDAFGPKWMIGFNITRVVPNIIESWIRGRQLVFGQRSFKGQSAPWNKVVTKKDMRF